MKSYELNVIMLFVCMLFYVSFIWVAVINDAMKLRCFVGLTLSGVLNVKYLSFTNFDLRPKMQHNLHSVPPYTFHYRLYQYCPMKSR